MERAKYLVISPCRNEAAYMRRTLDSMVAQSVRPDLWVIVDDGSSDQTPQILAEARLNRQRASCWRPEATETVFATNQ